MDYAPGVGQYQMIDWGFLEEEVKEEE